MYYSDKQVRDISGISITGLRKVRVVLRDIRVISDRERLDDAKIKLLKKIMKRQSDTGANYDTVVKAVVEEERKEEKRRNLLSIVGEALEENNEFFTNDVFHKVMEQYFPDRSENTIEIFLKSFVIIGDILRQTDDQDSAIMLEKLQEGIISKLTLRYLYQHGLVRRDNEEEED